ncbi:MAG: LysR family transcriptional regulator, partial [Pseudomonadales bacterium]|nr:LysR family transcriptional regulator [Pseudomonadales bacterium]
MSHLQDIAVFVEVIDAGSFTAAAEQLNLSKSVVSKAVTRLEDRLGVRLLNRTTRRLSLTEAGQAFYQRSQSALAELNAAEEEVSHLQISPRGVLRINTPMSFGILHIAPVISEFMARYPDIRVEMNLDDRKVDVIEEGFDVSVRISDLPDSTLIARRLCPCRHAVVAAPAYLERMGVPVHPGELINHNIISYQYQESALNWHFTDDQGNDHSVSVSGSLRMNNSLALHQALLAGAGITRTPTFIVGEDIRAGRLVSLMPGWRSIEPSVFLVYAQRKHLAPKVRAFVDFVAGKISEH